MTSYIIKGWTTHEKTKKRIFRFFFFRKEWEETTEWKDIQFTVRAPSVQEAVNNVCEATGKKSCVIDSIEEINT